ncbi:protein-glutamine gamma-glutamyltransferase E isoform X2 [Microcaecilia unicolor]|nr:protein-glutamine gamma-glutamyltransferase E-like isoform X2 [Microcaecilia unicolor]
MLIVRRGDPFTITLSSNRAVQPGDKVTFIVETGPTPSESTKTKAIFPMTGSKGNVWSAVQKSSTPNSLDVSISSPADAVIGDYKLSVQTSSTDASNLGVFRLLFNAWCKDDAVHMDNENYRKEYILNHFGIYFKGSEKYIYGRGWDYGQFEEDILDISLNLLDQSPEYTKDKVKDYSNRYDPNYVSKVICSMISINDGSPTTSDKRILMGRWEGSYTDGTSPTSWNSSNKILKEWKSGGYTPVKYGQCWVFAGVLCTVLRCLGIPSRLITNYNSGVDTALDLVVDDYGIAYSGSPPPKPPPKDDCDELWDFHVWNEGWFRRTDLDKGKKYDGWQTLDPTRQKRSGVTGKQTCGPASVRAIKEGDVDKNYDTAFVYAEIGSDYVLHLCTSPTKIETKERESGFIGKKISTKAVDKNDPDEESSREDVTINYKYPDGSPENRRVYKKAYDILHGPTTEVQFRALAVPRKPEISGRFTVPEPIEIGQDANVSLILKNLTSGAKTVKVDLSAFTVIYTGKQIQEIFSESRSVSLAASKEVQIPLKISYKQYENALTADNMIRAIASCEDTKTKENLILDQDIILKNPTISITVVERAVMKKPLNVDITFQNNLSSVVNNCSLVAEGSGLIKDQIKKTVSAVKSKERIKIPLQITPYRAGAQMLLLNFNCDKLKGVKGFKIINVLAA